jgi:hypothetical protein
MLRGINSDTIKQKTQKELDEKYGRHVTSVEAARRGDAASNEEGKSSGNWSSPEGFLAAAPEIAKMNQYW